MAEAGQRLALIVDGGKVTRWQADALRRLSPETEIAVYNCLTPYPSRRRASHFAYYLLNLVAIRGPWSKPMPVRAVFPAIAEWVDFEAETDGAWQRIPAPILGRMQAWRPAAVLKFGMSLTRVPPRETLAAPILSYHHGDPAAFRGRPAGFYEILQGRRMLGQIVQIIGDRLDAGAIVAFAETKVHAHSYRKTLSEAFAHSPLLLPGAIANAVAGRAIDHEVGGKNYRLPGNLRVLRFLLGLCRRKLGRLVYGLFAEKRWRVSLARAGEGAGADIAAGFPAAADWQTLDVPAGYTFIADPFFHPRGKGCYVEALRRKTGLGEIVHIDGPAATPVLAGPRHHSYPFTLTEEGTDYLMPEIAGWSQPRLYPVEGAGLGAPQDIDLPGGVRVIDPTPVRRGDTWFLFGNDAAEGGNVLRLWWSPTLSGPYREHPTSPVLISPAGGRMGGALLERDGKLIRFGQDGSGGYGDGLLAFEVTALTREHYLEIPVGPLRFAEVSGPHTLNLREGTLLFDWYRNVWTPLAGWRRLRARLAVQRGGGVETP